jgi:phosphoribosylanthranilate isomerase
MSLWIKICANTSLEDAQLAAEAGADAVGFIFAPSPRRVTAAQVAAITPQLPATVEKIGVFVDAPFEEIEATVLACSLTGVQLHFDAAPDLPAKLRQRFGPALRILRVVHFDPQEAAERLDVLKGHGFSRAASAATSMRASQAAEKRDPEGGGGFNPRIKPAESMGPSGPEGCFLDPNIDAILVDSRSAMATGGTGLTFDWSLAGKTLFQNTEARKRLVAAGGLNPSNVAKAIATLLPWGVDVASGVESAPGKKDPAKVREFVARARAAVGE